ncbi:MAG TPA: PQQ-dependent sugar dehydrogenase [Candidatus Acidoferrales bacterium]|nr:PQQ-dependent sugar dehydrogenase [Candidatus Acidoferrales bacterium]
MRKYAIVLAAFAAVAVIVPPARGQQVRATDFPPPKPAFPGQTNAPAPKKASPPLAVDTIVARLSSPWSFAFLPDGKMLVTERNGFMRIARKDGVYSAPIAGVPGVKVVAAQALHDVELDPKFSENRLIYFTYFAPPPGEDPAVWPSEYFYARVSDKPLAERRTMSVGTERVARARLSEDEKKLENVQTLLDGVDRRIVFAPDGTLYITGPDRFRFYDSKMDAVAHEITDPDVLRNFTGRVARINPDGSIPKDNPFLSQPTVLPETFSYGLRDPDGAAFNPASGELWVVEHGPMGGDRVLIARAGHDDGWPNVSYGRQYSGVPVGNGATSKPGVDQPVYFWYPDIAPSSAMFYTGDMFPEWKGNLFVGALVGKCLIRLVLDGDRVVAEEHLLVDLGQRIRDVRQGSDGAIYLLTDAGSLLRVTPKK